VSSTLLIAKSLEKIETKSELGYPDFIALLTDGRVLVMSTRVHIFPQSRTPNQSSLLAICGLKGQTESGCSSWSRTENSVKSTLA
jgi:hypothetical protein